MNLSGIYQIKNLINGKHPSEETLKKQKEIQTGKKRSIEVINRIRESNIGKHSKPISEEHKRKIGDSLRGRKRPRQSELMTGRKHTQEEIEKMSIARKRYWEERKDK